ncbi:MAG: conjugal transfer protein TraF [Acidimicrobiia bacterium]|nr:conjugal transfer protein TraF [Acidimicrobiia bacterium]
MIEPGTPLPDVEASDLRGRGGRLADLATNGVPIVLFASARSPLCRRLEPVFEAFARLDEGDYNVWAFIEGAPKLVLEAFPNLAGRTRCFPVPRGWDGLEHFGVESFPAVVIADRANTVWRSLQGWDRVQWQQLLHETEALLGWQPTILSRKLPGAARSPALAS